MSDFRPCAVVPTYENPRTVGRVVRDIHEAGLEVIVVDDGSSAPGEKACQILESDGIATRIRLERNSGKGAAVKAGFQRAAELELAAAEAERDTLAELRIENANFEALVEQRRGAIPWTWVVGALVVALGAGFVGGWWWLDASIRRRYGGFKMY